MFLSKDFWMLFKIREEIVRLVMVKVIGTQLVVKRNIVQDAKAQVLLIDVKNKTLHLRISTSIIQIITSTKRHLSNQNHLEQDIRRRQFLNQYRQRCIFPAFFLSIYRFWYSMQPNDL